MTNSNPNDLPRAAKWGWGILLVVSALMALNGVTWFFMGPGISISYLEEGRDVPMEEFIQAYPAVEEHMTRNTRQVAVWYGAFGSMALIVSLEGFRRGTRWAWNATWLVVAAPIAIGLVYYTPGSELSFDNVGLFSFGGLSLVGQLLTRKR